MGNVVKIFIGAIGSVVIKVKNFPKIFGLLLNPSIKLRQSIYALLIIYMHSITAHIKNKFTLKRALLILHTKPVVAIKALFNMNPVKYMTRIPIDHNVKLTVFANIKNKVASYWSMIFRDDIILVFRSKVKEMFRLRTIGTRIRATCRAVIGAIILFKNEDKQDGRWEDVPDGTTIAEFLWVEV